MYRAHDALLCIAEGRLLADAERRRVTPEHWFKPAAAMRALFSDLPDACDNTLAIRAQLRGDGGDAQAAIAGVPESA